MKSLVPILLLLALFGCNPQPAKVTDGEIQFACPASATVSNLSDPQTIAEVITYINALPKPVSVECFVKNLKRPLFVNASNSTSSAQPADGEESPRVFILKGQLVISIVPSGPGSRVIEFSDLTSDRTSIKGEIEAPVVTTLARSAPFAHIFRVDRTTCLGCHSPETQVDTIDGIPLYESRAFKAQRSKVVDFSSLEAENYKCEVLGSTTERCRIFNALFQDTDIFPQDFPATMPEFQ